MESNSVTLDSYLKYTVLNYSITNHNVYYNAYKGEMLKRNYPLVSSIPAWSFYTVSEEANSL